MSCFWLGRGTDVAVARQDAEFVPSRDTIRDAHSKAAMTMTVDPQIQHPHHFRNVVSMTTEVGLFNRCNIIQALTLMMFLIKTHSFQSATAKAVSAARKASRQISSASKMTIADTPLGTEEGNFLLDGLDVFSVSAKGDDHPLTVYGIDSSEPKADDNILLMLHGRTWSSVPVYHLMGGPQHKEQGYESRSLMELFVDYNIKPYAMDFRGFGGTPRDSKGLVEPNRCVEDVESVLAWLIARHDTSPERVRLSLMGWSQGGLVAQLAGQRAQPLFSKLILYGSIYDPMIRYPRQPLYTLAKDEHEDVENTWDGAVEDFTIEGSIPPETASKFAEAALLSDPIKAKWNQLYQFNNCDPGQIHVPTLVVSKYY